MDAAMQKDSFPHDPESPSGMKGLFPPLGMRTQPTAKDDLELS